MHLCNCHAVSRLTKNKSHYLDPLKKGLRLFFNFNRCDNKSRMPYKKYRKIVNKGIWTIITVLPLHAIHWIAACIDFKHYSRIPNKRPWTLIYFLQWFWPLCPSSRKIPCSCMGRPYYLSMKNMVYKVYMQVVKLGIWMATPP